MAGAAKIAAQRAISRSTTSTREAAWEMTSKKISSYCARIVTEPDIFFADHDKDGRAVAPPCHLASPVLRSSRKYFRTEPMVKLSCAARVIESEGP